MVQNSQTRSVRTQREGWSLGFRRAEGWEAKELAIPDGVKFFLRGPADSEKRLFASVIVQASPAEGHTLSQLARQWVEKRGAFRTFRILARSETTVAGMEAIQVDAAHDMPLPMMALNPEMVPVQERVIFTVHEGKAYQFTYRAVQDDFQSHLAAFEGVLASFSLEKQQ